MDKTPLKSAAFDDVYFSAEDGLAETKHVFLKGNNLPAAWEDKARFVIAETGFGTGLNMIAVWKLFKETAKKGQELDLISFEKFPLTPETIEKALTPWATEFTTELPRLLELYPPLIPGFHRLDLSEEVTLTLIFDDVNDALPQLDADIDAWFLDGFKPATNPDMWSKTLFTEMARLSHSRTSFATFTAAGIVKRGLKKMGFDVQKIAGFGRKRDMLVGHKP